MNTRLQAELLRFQRRHVLYRAAMAAGVMLVAVVVAALRPVIAGPIALMISPMVLALGGDALHWRQLTRELRKLFAPAAPNAHERTG